MESQGSPIKQQLERLRASLATGPALDDALKADLAVLEADIHRALGDGASPAGLMSRARELSLRFAEQHPTAAAVLRELGVLLEGIGA